MNNSELFMQEFDKLPKDEQFRLGVSGLFQMVQDEAGRMPTGEQARRGYGSLLGQRGRQDKEDDTRLHRDTVREMSSSITNQVQKVKITDVLTDVIQPMEDVLRRISFDNRLHKNRLHHENTLYYQGIINAVNAIGKEGSNTIFRSLYLKWQGFMRHPIWNSFLMLNDYVLKPLGRLSAALLFGKREDPIQKKILKAIKEQTEFMMKGSITSPSVIRRLIDQGVVGFAFNQAISGVSDVFSSLFGGDERKSEGAIGNEYLSTIAFQGKYAIQGLSSIDSKVGQSSNAIISANIKSFNEVIGELRNIKDANIKSFNEVIGELRNIKDANYNISSVVKTGIAANDEVFEEIRMAANGRSEIFTSINQLNYTISSIQQSNAKVNRTIANVGGTVSSMLTEANNISKEAQKHQKTLVDNEEQKLTLQEEMLIEQKNTRDELEDHNKREKRRTLLRGLGKLLSGGGLLAGAGALLIGAITDTKVGSFLRDNISKGVRWGFGKLFDFATEKFDYSQIAMGIGGALMLIPPFTKLGAIVLGMGALVTFAKYASRELGLSKLAGPDLADVPDTDTPFFQTYGSMSQHTPAAERAGFDIAMGSLSYLKEKRRELEDDIEQARQDRDGYERSDELITLNKQLKSLNDRIGRGDFFGLTIKQDAIESALMVTGRTSASSSSSGRNRSTNGNGLLDMIAQVESRGDYNALVYGNNTPRTADLTNMTIGEVLEHQRGMIGRGHASTAVGRYQIINKTLRGLVGQMSDIDESTRFSEEVQDQLATQLMRGRGLDAFLRGDISIEEFADNLSKEWAALPAANGRSNYHGIAGNRAGMSRDELISAIESYTNGSTGNSRAASRFSTEAITSAGAGGVKAILDVFTGGQLGESTTGFLNEALGSIGIDMPEKEEKEVTAVISDASFKQLSSQIGRIEEALSNIPGASIEIADNFTE